MVTSIFQKNRAEDALMISQLQLNKLEINPFRFKALPAINDEIKQLKSIYTKKEFKIENRIIEDAKIYFDNYLFRHFIYNILENSIKPGKIPISNKQDKTYYQQN